MCIKYENCTWNSDCTLIISFTTALQGALEYYRVLDICENPGNLTVFQANICVFVVGFLN